MTRPFKLRWLERPLADAIGSASLDVPGTLLLRALYSMPAAGRRMRSGVWGDSRFAADWANVKRPSPAPLQVTLQRVGNCLPLGQLAEQYPFHCERTEEHGDAACCRTEES